MIPAFFLKNIISFVLAVLGLPCCKGYSLVAVRGLLTVEASLVVEHRLNSGGVWA